MKFPKKKMTVKKELEQLKASRLTLHKIQPRFFENISAIVLKLQGTIKIILLSTYFIFSTFHEFHSLALKQDLDHNVKFYKSSI